ncbi:MAG: hypothetical protein ABIU05_13790 [Nitrospirales bacterium]
MSDTVLTGTFPSGHIYGATLEEELQAATERIHELNLKQPGLKNLLRSKGIGDNALIASMLIGRSAINHPRKGR